MVIKRIAARRVPKGGRVAITFEVAAATWSRMRRSARAGAHPDTLDYIAAHINMAFLDDAPPPRKVAAADETDDGVPF